jgi:hypothetical protein
VLPCRQHLAALVPSRAWHSDNRAVAVTGMEEQPLWRALIAFHCSHNCISAMDPSLRLLPALQVACLLTMLKPWLSVPGVSVSAKRCCSAKVV